MFVGADFLSIWLTAGVALQWQATHRAPVAVKSGSELYKSACAACHGEDGRGLPQELVGFRTPLPDFTECSFTTPEPDADWYAVIHNGGPVRAFDRMMPAFGDALSEVEILAIVKHIRTFCLSSRWPPGELNFPRALFTEKAFPENEAVWTMTVASNDNQSIANQFLYERRLGALSQVELLVPVEFQQMQGKPWQGGLGDLAFAFKRVLVHSAEGGTIISAAGEVVLPTGDEDRGLGRGTTIFEPFVALGQTLPAEGFFQVQAGFELPVSDTATSEVFWRVTGGKSYFEGRMGRSWSPMVEVLGSRELQDGGLTAWDVVPQVQVTLSTRQHVMVNAGVRIPINRREERATEVVAYLLWDWFDGGFLSGW